MAFEYIADFLKNYRHLGQERLSNGTLLVGKAPHIAPEAWLHRVFPPLTKKELGLLEKKLGEGIPPSYRQFLLHCNGLGVFNTTLSLDGLRSNYKRTGKDASGQPFDILTPNTLEKPDDTNDLFIIGGYDWDGSKLCIRRSDEKVFVLKTDTGALQSGWSNFDAMLSSELKRLRTLFDSSGREKDSSQSTLPPF